MTDEIVFAEDDAPKAQGPAARRKAQRAAAAKRASSPSISGRVARHFKKPAVRRRTAMILLLAGVSVAAYSKFGPQAPQDVAAGLTNVTDAASDMASAVENAFAPTQMAAAPEAAAPAPESMVAPTVSSDSDVLPPVPSEPEVEMAMLDTPAVGELRDVRLVQASSGEGDCAVMVEAMPLAAATIALDISAPCDGGKRLDIIHDDLQIAVALDEDGKISVDMPALSSEPFVAVLIDERDPVTLQAEAVDYEAYHRALLHWQGQAGLELHAFEGEATYGDEGHVGPESPRTIAHALSGNGGFLMTVGDPALEDSRMAMIYTVPVGTDVGLSIEAPVTEANCGKDVYGGTIQTGPGLAAVSQEITLTMPDCDAIGDFVMLGSLMQPIAVAAN